MTSREPVPRLGRGLAVFFGESRTGGTANDTELRMIETALLQPSPFQPRGPLTVTSLAELADSIRTQGVLQPILVRPISGAPASHNPVFQIIAGERRWRAAQVAGLAQVPCVVRPMSDGQASVAALVENLQRDDLNAIEEAEGLQRLGTDFGMIQEAVADLVGKSRSHVANTMRLLKLPPQVQLEVRRGALSAGHARALLSHPDPARAALSVIARGLTVRQTEALASSPERSLPDPASRDPDIRALEQSLTEKLGLQVKINSRGKGGRISIDYTQLDQLDGLIRLLTV